MVRRMESNMLAKADSGGLDPTATDAIGKLARLARKGHQVLADLRHAAGEILDALQVALRLGLAVALEQQQRIVGIGADCRQRLVELVAERRRHLAERGELAGLHQIVLRAPEVGSALLEDRKSTRLNSSH